MNILFWSFEELNLFSYIKVVFFFFNHIDILYTKEKKTTYYMDLFDFLKNNKKPCISFSE